MCNVILISLLPTDRLEWRPPELSTLIFKIRIQWDKERKPHYQIMVSDQKAHRYYDDISPEQSLAQM